MTNIFLLRSDDVRNIFRMKNKFTFGEKIAGLENLYNWKYLPLNGTC